MPIIAVAILLILAIPSLMPGVSGQGPGIALVDSTGTELGDRSFMTSQVGFDTFDTKEGTRYLLQETTEIETIETYIRWVELYAGFFDLRISVSPADGGSYGFLSTTGITIAVYDGDTPYYAVLDPDDGYEAVVSDIATGEPHSFQPGQDDNRIRVFTNQSYDSYTAPTDALKLTFTFTAESQDLHLIEYISEAEIVGTKLLPGDAELGDPPQVTRSGYDLLGWKDSNGRMVTPQTVVATLPSDQLTAEWTPSGGDDDWPKIDVEDKDVTEPDGTEVHTETTTIRYEDGTRTVIIEKVIDRPNGDETLMEQVTTTYPDRKKDTTTTLVTETTHEDGSKDIAFEYEQRLRDGTWTITESTESYDPVTRLILRDETTESGDSQGTISKSGSDVEIVYHDDGTVTRTERTYDEDRSGHRHEEEKVQELNRDEDLTRESRDIRITEPGTDPREYGIEYVVTTDDRTVYATMADLNPADMDVIQDIIDEYDYTEDFLGVFRDDGVLTVSDGMLPIISEMGCGLYAHRGAESVSIDAEIVAALAKGEGVLELRIEHAAGHMNPRQERAVGGSYAASVTLTMDSEFVTDLPGKAEIVLEPGYYSADAFRVEEDGTLTRIDAEYDWETGAVSFAVDHFSIYMVEMHKEPPKELPWMWIAMGIAALAAMLLIIFAAAKRRRRSDA